jgi:hypothetical protein
MGEFEPIILDTSASGRWTGQHQTKLVHLASLFESLVAAQFEESPENEFWRKVLPPGYTFIRQLGDRTVHIRAAEGGIIDLVLRFAPPRPKKGLRRITGPVQHSRAQRRFMWSQRLRILGINTPLALGFIENEEDPSFSKSFVVTEYSHAPTLLEFRDEKLVAILRSTPNAAFEKNAYRA